MVTSLNDDIKHISRQTHQWLYIHSQSHPNNGSFWKSAMFPIVHSIYLGALQILLCGILKFCFCYQPYTFFIILYNFHYRLASSALSPSHLPSNLPPLLSVYCLWSSLCLIPTSIHCTLPSTNIHFYKANSPLSLLLPGVPFNGASPFPINCVVCVPRCP